LSSSKEASSQDWQMTNDSGVILQNKSAWLLCLPNFRNHWLYDMKLVKSRPTRSLILLTNNSVFVSLLHYSQEDKSNILFLKGHQFPFISNITTTGHKLQDCMLAKLAVFEQYCGHIVFEQYCGQNWMYVAGAVLHPNYERFIFGSST
jgi:hypothetical protein